MSASSHTRGHRFSPELTAATLSWLTQYGRRVVNGPGALDLEISKVRQYGALARAGVAIPRSVVVAGKGRLVERSEEHTSELQSLMRISFAVFCLKKRINNQPSTITHI